MRWAQVILKTTGSEVWRCTRALNNRCELKVMLVGTGRYRTDTRDKTSVRELTAEGWELNHRFVNPF